MGLLFLAAGYSATSATLSIVNKWALVRFPYSGALTVLQFGFAAGAVRLLAALKLVECDALDWKTVKAFAPAVVMFYASIASNMRLLAASTVDTFVVVRSVVPIATQVGELLFFERSVAPAPSALQVASLAVIAVGAAGYGSANAAVLSPAVAGWAALYLACISGDTLVVKKVVSSVELSRWGYVYYNNLLALAVFPAWAWFSGELARLATERPLEALGDPVSCAAVALSCAIGLGISFFGLNARRALSATAFTVLGVACKFLSIAINSTVWAHHAPHAALPWLLLALLGSVLYQKASNLAKDDRDRRTSRDAAEARKRDRRGAAAWPARLGVLVATALGVAALRAALAPATVVVRPSPELAERLRAEERRAAAAEALAEEAIAHVEAMRLDRDAARARLRGARGM